MSMGLVHARQRRATRWECSREDKMVGGIENREIFILFVPTPNPLNFWPVKSGPQNRGYVLI
jgi:hypothetical protein